jgi:hypothetical protein
VMGFISKGRIFPVEKAGISAGFQPMLNLVLNEKSTLAISESIRSRRMHARLSR